MLRFSVGVTRVDRIRTKQVRGTVKVEQFGDNKKKRDAKTCSVEKEQSIVSKRFDIDFKRVNQ